MLMLIHVSLLCKWEHYWRRYGLQELRTQHNVEVSSVGQFVSYFATSLLHCILPAVHALTRADTASKVDTNRKAFKKVNYTKHQDELAMLGEGN